MNTREVDFDKNFLDFVQQQIAHFSKEERLGESANINYIELVAALHNFQNIYRSLLSLKAKANREMRNSQREYERWYDDRFLIIKRREHKLEIAAQKWSSAHELNAMTRNENQDEYYRFKQLLDDLEERHVFISGMLEGWKIHSHTLNNLTGIFKAEANSQGLERSF